MCFEAARLVLLKSPAIMNAQILDVDCVQIGKGAHAASWLGLLRTNEALYSATPDAKEIGRRDKQEGYAYVVRL